MKTLILTSLLICCIMFAAGQDSVPGHNYPYGKNLLKLNVTAPILKNYALQYERIINKRVSVALAGRFMPASTLPFKNTVRREVIKVDDELITEAFNQALFSNYAITPEVRFYLGKKGYGRGFYVAPYYRLAKYTVKELDYTYQDVPEDITINLKGSLTSHTGGILLGAQWMLGRTVGLDWWIAGPNIGGGKGQLGGRSSQPLDADMQRDVRESLENDLDIPFTRTAVEVNANGADIRLNGPWAGVRAGLLLTFRF